MADRESRVQREKTAYNEGDVWEHSHKLQTKFAHVFSCPNTMFGEDYFRWTMGRAATDGVLLDYGCYDGQLCETLLKHNPKRIIGIDISERAIEEARKKYGEFGDYRTMDAHRLEFKDNYFDLVVGRAILHHLEFETAIREIRRVLRPGGLALFYEPLGDNPAAKLFRHLTPRARTADETPLSRKQIRLSDKIFGKSRHLCLNLFSVPAGMVSSFVFKSPDNFLTRFAHRIDMAVADSFIKYWMRTAVLVWEKA